MISALFLALEFAVISAALLGTYGLRARLGLGPVIAVVASLQFFQSLLGASLYWPFGPDLLLSPGSCVLFAGNLAMVTYAFARDGVIPARAILYGIMIANGVNIVVDFIIAAHIEAVEPVRFLDVPTELFDRGLVASLVGIVLLYLDQILALLGFAWLRRHVAWLPIWATMALVLATVLAFDTIGYLVPLFWGTPQLVAMLTSGLIAKTVGGVAFGLVWGLIATRDQPRTEESLSDIIGVLLFREDLSTLRRAAVTDEMTGLYNRRSYRLIIDRVIEESRSAGEAFSLLVIDADHFKQVNDTLGHKAGDAVLVSIGASLRTATRGHDFCFRLGGDEFAVVLPNCPLAGAREVAERIGMFEFTDPALPVPVSLTIGIANYPVDGTHPDTLFEAGDQRLYHGKQRGRGRVVDA